MMRDHKLKKLMRKLIPLVLIFIIVSCKEKKQNPDGPVAETPKALQDNKVSSSISYKKRGPDDLVDELYNEKLETTPALNAFEKKFRELSENKIDSLHVFHEFDSKNLQYYNTANGHISQIQDSFLKKELKTFFENNKTAYSSSINRLKNLEVQLGKQQLSAIDRRTALKLFVTLNMMNEFKKKNMPQASSIESIVNAFKTLNWRLDSAISKNK